MLQNQSKMMEDQRKQTEMLQRQMQSFMANIGSVSLHGPDTMAACATTVKTGTLPTSKPIVHPPGLRSPSMVPTELATPRSLPTPPAVLRRDDRWAEESAFQTNFRPTNDESRRAPGGGGDPPNDPNGPDKPPDGHKDAPWEGKPNPRPKVRDGGGGDGPSDDDGDGGDDGGDSGDDGNDSDRKFLRRMKALMGYGGSSKKDDNRVKEADSVKLPGWPQPETYRNWRIKVRDAVVAASAKPDEAFKWISETWKDNQTLAALEKPSIFPTLDAKLLSALTNILTGDVARIIDTYKETEAAAGRMVRGRQVLFKLHEYFSTNIKHGATYALQDLFSVRLKGENLKSFIANWDQVLAGLEKIPDVSVLETLLYNQVKNCRAINHDMNEYHRAADGSATKSYDFLVQAVRRHLDRTRLETNPERIARNLGSHPSSLTATPAVDTKTGYILKGYCIKWNKGECKDDKCKYKHETPPAKRAPSKSARGRSPTRSKSPRVGKRVCKFWKQGRCDRGDQCKFSHEGKPGKPRAATPARNNSRDSSASKSSGSRAKAQEDPEAPEAKALREAKPQRAVSPLRVVDRRSHRLPFV